MNKTTRAFAVAVALCGFAGAAGANVYAPWVGTADYDGVGGIAETNPFTAYSMNTGAVFSEQIGEVGTPGDDDVGDTWANYLTMSVDSHILGITEQDVVGYELTLVAEFEHVITNLTPIPSFSITGGTWALFFDNPGDLTTTGLLSGYADGTQLLAGSVLGGGAIGTEVKATIKVDSKLNGVFDPEDVRFTVADFGFEIGSDLLAGVTGISETENASNGGFFSFTGDYTSADYDVSSTAFGTLQLYTPIPAAVWLFGTALIGFLGYSRRQSLFGSDEKDA